MLYNDTLLKLHIMTDKAGIIMLDLNRIFDFIYEHWLSIVLILGLLYASLYVFFRRKHLFYKE